MKGASAADWLALRNFRDLRNQVYLYDGAGHSARHPAEGEIAWPIIWVLGRYHQKHIWLGKALPRVERYAADLEQVEARLRWRWTFNDEAP